MRSARAGVLITLLGPAAVLGILLIPFSQFYTSRSMWSLAEPFAFLFSAVMPFAGGRILGLNKGRLYLAFTLAYAPCAFAAAIAFALGLLWLDPVKQGATEFAAMILITYLCPMVAIGAIVALIGYGWGFVHR